MFLYIATLTSGCTDINLCRISHLKNLSDSYRYLNLFLRIASDDYSRREME